MPITFAAPEESGKPFLYGKDPDTGKPIHLTIAPLPAADRERIMNEELLAGLKARGLRDISAIASAARSRAFGRRVAMICLRDSEGFEIAFAGKMRETQAAKIAALGLAMSADGVVALDGHWTDEVKSFVFDLVPDVVDFVVSKESEIHRAKEADEEEQTAGFR